MLTLLRVWMPAWVSASDSDLYDSVRSTYLPTIAMFTECSGRSSAATMRFHVDRSVGGASSMSFLQTIASRPSACSAAGIL